MVHIGTAQTLVLCLGRQTVESVTEFMQERLNLVGIEKHRVAACRFREIADNRNQRYRLVTLVIFCLGTEFSHPGTRTEIAQLMGKKNFAEYQLQNTMAKTPGAVMEFLENLRKNYTAPMKAEIAEIEQFARNFSKRSAYRASRGGPCSPHTS